MTLKTEKRVGLVGLGVIGSHILRNLDGVEGVTVDYVYDEVAEKIDSELSAAVLGDVSEVFARNVDLVIETATASAVKVIAPEVLKKSDLLIFSVTSLADDDFRELLRETCSKFGTRLFVPHGAILGLDGIYDGRSVIEEVVITTTKHPKNLGLSEMKSGVLYDGPTRGACDLFPRNVNVHAAIATVGLGFDKTRSVVVADENTKHMTHKISVKGQGLAWEITIASIPVGAVTGSYTPESAANTVRRVLATECGIVLA